MNRFLHPLTPAVLLTIIFVAGLFGGPTNTFDIATVRYLAALRADQPRLTEAAILLTWLGSAYATLGVGTLTALWFFWTKRLRHAAFLATAVLSARLLLDVAKVMVARARPAFDEHPVDTHSWSFPSGHAANTMAVFLIVALFVLPPRYRRAAIATAVMLSVAIGLTRPYLGVHWPSDLIGGWSLGLLAAWLAVTAGERLGVLPVEQQHQIVGRHRSSLDQR